jgi:hypothetical protein
VKVRPKSGTGVDGGRGKRIKMRDIKFKVWDNTFKKMVLCNEAKFIDGKLIGMKGVNWDSMVIPLEFTGLKDKQGKDIYEGDIVKYLHEMSYIEWRDGAFELVCNDKFATHLWNVILNKLEIIGNIYENPELIKGDNHLKK